MKETFLAPYYYFYDKDMQTSILSQEVIKVKKLVARMLNKIVKRSFFGRWEQRMRHPYELILFSWGKIGE